MGFDFEGTYTRIVSKQALEYRMSNGREVKVEFVERPDGILVKETFDAETENTPELQRQGHGVAHHAIDEYQPTLPVRAPNDCSRFDTP